MNKRSTLIFVALICALEAVAFGASTSKHFISGEHGGIFGIFAHQLKFFTLWSNILVMGMFGYMVVTRKFLHDGWLAAMTLWLLIVMAVWHLLLGNDEPQRGLSWLSNILFHTVNPLLLLLFWIGFAPKSQLRWRHCAIWLGWPLVYVIYAVTRGIFTGYYPYFFVNLDELGWAGLFGWAAKFLIAFYVAGLLIVGLSKLINRRGQTGQATIVPDDPQLQ